MFTEGCLVVAEVGQAHEGSLGMAHSYIDAAAGARADAIKFQTHLADAESTPDEPWRVRFSTQDETRYDYWKRMEFTEPQWKELRAHAQEKGLRFISSPFSIEAVDLLARIDVDAYKVASGELTNLPLLEAIASQSKPSILSSGMSPWEEIDRAFEILGGSGAPVAVLQCTSEYPCPPELVGLNVIEELRSRYDAPVGLSDHSGTMFPGLAAATLGIEVLEIHVTMSRQMFGPDVPASVTIEELETLVSGIQFIERARANPVDKGEVAHRMEPLRQTFMKSIVASRDLEKGATLRPGDLAFKKPGSGMTPSQISEVIGMRLRRDVLRDEQIKGEDLGE